MGKYEHNSFTLKEKSKQSFSNTKLGIALFIFGNSNSLLLRIDSFWFSFPFYHLSFSLQRF